MHHPLRQLRLPLLAGASCAVLAIGLAILSGCGKGTAPRSRPIISYTDLGPKKDIPSFMKGTIWELTDRSNDEGYAAASYGMVSRLRGTGDCTASLLVRQWMVKQMTVHGYGSQLVPGYEKIGVEQVLRNPSYAIVRVDALIPPGARDGDFFDVRVSALPGNKTSNLAGGLLFASELHKIRGNAPDLEGVDILAKAKGPIVVNPAYALAETTSTPSGQAKASLRAGIIMDGGVATRDRPLILRLRSPSRANTRAIEMRINQRFQNEADHPKKNVMPVMYQVAAAIDDGVIEVYVPKTYKGDWQHFIGVVEQLQRSSSPGVAIAKAKELIDEAVKPDALLQEISYALEGIGEPALQYTLPLMVHPNPDVAFAMARASVFIGDNSGAAQDTLLRMARADDHPFQLAAIQTLGALPSSPERNQKLRDILESRNRLSRTETYKVLARNNSSMYTKVIGEKFFLDVVEADGEPMIFASSSGLPRIALIGPRPQLNLPIIFTAMNGRLMISSPTVGKTVTLFYREDGRAEPIKMLSRPDLAEIIRRLGGEGAPEEERFNFSYGEIIALLQMLDQQKKITAARADGQLTLAPFIFEQPRDTQDFIETTPVIEDKRLNTGERAEVGRKKDEG